MKHRLLSLPVAALLLVPAAFFPRQSAGAAALDGFASATIDIGVVVGDLDASAAFYGEALGLREAPGFSVGAEFCAKAGLTESLPLTIRVFSIGAGSDGDDGGDATRLKLMALPDARSKASDNAVHSQLGFSYITLRVDDLAATMARLKEAGVAPLAEGPVALGDAPDGPALILVRDPDGNLIELIGPLR